MAILLLKSTNNSDYTLQHTIFLTNEKYSCEVLSASHFLKIHKSLNKFILVSKLYNFLKMNNSNSPPEIQYWDEIL